MKEVQITETVFEVGDVVDISKQVFLAEKTVAQQDGKGIIIDDNYADGENKYTLFSNYGKILKWKGDNDSQNLYLGHIDMGLLFGENKGLKRVINYENSDLFDMEPRTITALRKEGILTKKELMEFYKNFGITGIQEIKGMGRKSTVEVMKYLGVWE